VGVDLDIWVNKKDIPKLFELNSQVQIWDDFYFLLNWSGIRWYRFQEKFNLESDNEPKTSKELLDHLARSNIKIKDRDSWVNILNKYDLIFAPDTKYKEIKEKGTHMEISDLESWIKKLVKEHINELIGEGK